jgi:hypothetical protein
MSVHKHGLVLSVAWKLLTELVRRHGKTHDLRLLRSHPGTSVAGQLKLLVNPRSEGIHNCTQVALNLGGPVGTFEVYLNGGQTTTGDFLMPALAGGLATVLDEVERAMSLNAPPLLPASTPQMLTMRLVSEMMTATWLDRQEYGLETA